jgi:hypothetical protein
MPSCPHKSSGVSTRPDKPASTGATFRYGDVTLMRRNLHDYSSFEPASDYYDRTAFKVA